MLRTDRQTVREIKFAKIYLVKKTQTLHLSLPQIRFREISHQIILASMEFGFFNKKSTPMAIKCIEKSTQKARNINIH